MDMTGVIVLYGLNHSQEWKEGAMILIMKRSNTQELNLLPVFRTFAVLWLGLMVLMMVGDLIDNNPQSRLLRDWLYFASAACW